ncbi:YbhB/YbcL family Raf kinase inhibitor-like protein [Phaeovulum vinaykumarii]|uniref:Phospholipid-binding protein, PBP family n=1 Tax=Phaeovulum vinaykumarii TaxID=407234 RepID=A0A1N7N0U6_9RHOB|nr:YbhB/YbcL family Raf kinase inhibitor-like protein [Phaeovulum vinaykumarii]SIS91945.1 phospholipid-binding protein, PBP family [Phaeovulum vinaykumarii]SOC17889.1 PBP family phospholipid-binding protein [Phaeovulum vinaykumarii]
MKTISTAMAAATTLLGVMSASADEFKLTSPDLAAGASISASQYANAFGCSGENARPALAWSGAPEGTKGFAVTLYDKDAPTGSGFWHWVVTGIAASATGIDAQELPDGAKVGMNDAGVKQFIGPCPPVGRQHTYEYSVYALDTDTLGAPDDATDALTGFFLWQHTLAKATLDFTAGPRK